MALFIYESNTMKVFSGSAGPYFVTNIEISKENIHILDHTSDQLVDVQELGAQTQFLIKRIEQLIEEKKNNMNSEVYEEIKTEYTNVTNNLLETLRSIHN